MITLTDDELVFLANPGDGALPVFLKLSLADGTVTRLGTMDQDYILDDFTLRPDGRAQWGNILIDIETGQSRQISDALAINSFSSRTGVIAGADGVQITTSFSSRFPDQITIDGDGNGLTTGDINVVAPFANDLMYEDGGLWLNTGDLQRFDFTTLSLTGEIIDRDQDRDGFRLDSLSLMADGRIVGFITGDTGTAVGMIDRETGVQSILMDISSELEATLGTASPWIRGSATYAENLPADAFTPVTFTFTSGDDTYFGNSETDAVTVDGPRFEYQFVRLDDDTVQAARAGQGLDTFNSAESFVFSDETVAVADIQSVDPGLTFNQTVSVTRFFNTEGGGHFFTLSDQEAGAIDANLPHFSNEGARFEALAADDTLAGTIDVHRFFNMRNGSHFFTTSEKEKNEVQANLSDVFSYEGVAFKAWGHQVDGGVYLERYFDTQTGAHYYARNVRDDMAALDHVRYEGIGFWAMPEGFI